MTQLAALLRILLTAMLVWLGAAFAVQAQGFVGTRLALVVGNSNYESVYSLKNAVNDSKAVAESLVALGFEVVLLNDATFTQMSEAVETMAVRAEQEHVQSTLFYFSGHGFQLGGANYIVPVDAVLDDREKIEERTLRLDAVIGRLDAMDRQTLILLDACRDNPLPASVRGADAANGLAEIRTGINAYVAFATAPGAVSLDGKGGQGPFARALVNNITLPDISVPDMMNIVRSSVLTQTRGLQYPWENNTLLTPFYFNPGNAETGVAFGTFEGTPQPNDFEAGVSFGQASAIDVVAVAPTPVAPVPVQTTTPTPVAVVPVGSGTVSAPTPVSGNKPAPATLVADIPTEESRSVVGTEVTPQVSEPVLSVPTPAVTEEVKTATLEPGVPKLTPLDTAPNRIIGTDISPEEDSPEPVPLTPIPEPVDVALAAQEELKRLGCYVGALDGDWGNGSRAALRRYFDGKNQDATETEPTTELLVRLNSEKGVICEREPVVASPPQEKRPTPTAPTRPKVATTKPEPAPSKPKLSLGGGGSGSFR